MRRFIYHFAFTTASRVALPPAQHALLCHGCHMSRTLQPFFVCNVTGRILTNWHVQLTNIFSLKWKNLRLFSRYLHRQHFSRVLVRYFRNDDTGKLDANILSFSTLCFGRTTFIRNFFNRPLSQWKNKSVVMRVRRRRGPGRRRN